MCQVLRTPKLWLVVLTVAGVFPSAVQSQDRRDGGGREEGRREDYRRDEGSRGEGSRGDRGSGRDEGRRDSGRSSFGPGGGFGGPGGFPGGGFPGGGFGGGGFGGGGFGGFPGGGFPGGGFPGGGFGSSGGGFNPTDMLRRLDENNNGMIDPAESSGRARFMLERVPGIDLSRPISISRLSDAMQRSRDSGRSSSDRDSGRSSSGSSASKTVDPLVPGFGIDESLPLPLPFGVKGAEVISVATSPEDMREAEERLRRYDENRDGVLDREEISRNRWSGDDPFVFDQNRDGKINVTELAMRYAKRRESEGRSRGSNSSSSSGFAFSRGGPPGSDRSSSSGGSSGDQRSEMMVRFMFDRLDANKSGVIEKDEWANSRSDPSAADTNKDNRITREELAAWLPSQMSGRGFGGPGGGPGGSPGFGGPGFGGPGGEGDRFGRRDEGDRRDGGSRDGGSRDGGSRDGDRRESSRDGGSGSFYTRRSSDAKSGSSSKGSDISSYRALTPTERLPKGLPEWFARNDLNADGQVAMAEYSASWSNSVANEFKQFDSNQDGFVTAKECITANDKGVIRGTASSSSSSYSSRPSNSTSSPRSTSSSTPTPPTTQAAAATPSAPSATAPAPAASAAAPIDSRTLAYAQQVVTKYDKNGDGALVKSEWDSMSKSPEKADADGDGKITPQEYAAWFAAR